MTKIARRTDIDADGFLDVVLHADNKVCEIAGRIESPEYLAQIVANDPKCTGAVRLIACLTGNTTGVTVCFAQRFANALKNEMVLLGKAGDVRVLGTNGMWMALNNGTHFPVPAKLVNGKWVENYDLNAPKAEIITFTPQVK